MGIKPLLSVVIVTYNSADVISNTLESIFKYFVTFEYEIIIIDNNSSDNISEIICKFNTNRIKLIKNKYNVGFAKANNTALEICTGDYILILNPDIIITSKTNLSFLINELNKDNNIGVVAPKLLYENGELQESARNFPNPLLLLIRGSGLERFFKKFKFYKNYLYLDIKNDSSVIVEWVIGAFILIKSNKLQQINYFDEKYFMYYEDADLCLRLLKNDYKTLYVSKCEAIHKYQRESAKKIFSKLKYYHIKSIIRFFRKHFFFLIFRKKYL